MIKTSQLLKSEREKQGISLEDVAITTRINLKILVAIESADLSSLPARPFLRGFVRAYAKFLKMDEKEILKSFESDFKIEPEIATTDTSAPHENIKKEVVQKTDPLPVPKSVDAKDLQTKNMGMRILFGSAVIILSILIIFVVQTARKYERESEINVEPESVEELKHDENDSSEVVTDTTLPANSSDSTEPTATAVADATTTTVTSTSVTTTTTTQKTETTVTTFTTTTIRITSTTLPAVSQAIDVVIEALDRVSIDYRADNGGLVSKTLKPEEVLNIRAQTSLNIDFSDGGVVNVIYNGKDLGVPGSLGQSHKLRLPR
ncbi:MAG: helix-turn-helix domain-containing protein [Bdellovibrionales bacterium]|nr:helix-turn-helix domain-containing protein [Bdellovibrionales bacterium]